MFFLSSGTLLSLRTLKPAFICMLPLILVDSDVSATEWVFDVPFSTASVCEKYADGLTCQRNCAAPRTVRPSSSSSVSRLPLK